MRSGLRGVHVSAIRTKGVLEATAGAWVPRTVRQEKVPDWLLRTHTSTRWGTNAQKGGFHRLLVLPTFAGARIPYA